MKKNLYILLTLILALILCACNIPSIPNPTQTSGENITDSTGETITEPTIVTEPETTTAPTETTAPLHSPLYLAQHDPQQMLEFFNEVVLNMEYTDGTGDATLVQKWLAPIYYQYYGKPTDEDKAVLSALFAQLNAIPGFPGIHYTDNPEQVTLSLNFLNEKDFNNQFQEVVHGETAWGATQFWYYTATNELFQARIGYRTDIEQATRNSILIEEIINTLGISDTVLREDSIVYQYSNDNFALSDVDWVIVKLLYNPAIQCGMNATDCAKIIQELYY